MGNTEKNERLNEIKELLQPFCDQHLNEELTGYVIKLCDKLGRKRTISITRGRAEIWAAAVVYVIARLNFLFDQENSFFLTADTICEFFGTKKSTIGSKATQIEKDCKLGLGAEGFCSSHISEMLSFVQTPDGFILPKRMLSDREIEIVFVDGEEAKELEEFAAEEQRRKEREAEEKKARRIEINRKIAEEKRREKHRNQCDLFGDI